jgi:hypothetical protein
LDDVNTFDRKKMTDLQEKWLFAYKNAVDAAKIDVLVCF